MRRTMLLGVSALLIGLLVSSQADAFRGGGGGWHGGGGGWHGGGAWTGGGWRGGSWGTWGGVRPGWGVRPAWGWGHRHRWPLFGAGLGLAAVGAWALTTGPVPALTIARWCDGASSTDGAGASCG